MHEFGAMQLLAAGNQSVDHGDADAASNIAQQVVQSAGIADFLVSKACHGHRRKRDEDAAGTETAEDNCPDEAPLRDLESCLAKAQAADGKQQKASDNEPAVIDLR